MIDNYNRKITCSNETACSKEDSHFNTAKTDNSVVVEDNSGVKNNCYKLEQGMVVKNYRVMCDILGEPIRDGDSRKYQLINWGRYFDYDKDGQKFIINKVYETELPKVDNRKLRDQVYAKYIELLLMQFIVFSENEEEEDNVIRVSKSVLLRLLGMMPPKYIEGQVLLRDDPEAEYKRLKENIAGLSNTPFEPGDVWNFYGRVKDKVYRMFDTALASMQSKRLIEYFKEYNITEPYRENEARGVYGVRNKEGLIESRKRKNKEFRPATNEEIQDILDAEHEAMTAMGYTKLGEIYCRNLQRSFHANSLMILKKTHNWVDYYPQVKIIFLRDYIKNDMRVMEETLLKMTTEQQIIGLNGEVIKALKTNAQRKYDNAVKADNAAKESLRDHGEGWGDNAYGITNIDINGKLSKLGGVDFVAIQNSLTDYLMTISKTESIRLAKYINGGNVVGLNTYKHKFKIDKKPEKSEQKQEEYDSSMVWRDGQLVDMETARIMDEREQRIDYSKL